MKKSENENLRMKKSENENLRIKKSEDGKSETNYNLVHNLTSKMNMATVSHTNSVLRLPYTLT